MRTEILVKLPQYDAPATQTARRSNPIQEQNTLGTGRQAEETDLVYGQAKRKTLDILLCDLSNLILFQNHVGVVICFVVVLHEHHRMLLLLHSI